MRVNLTREEVEKKTMSRESLRFLSENEINRIQQLLAATELSFQNIADRMDCAKSTIIAINRNTASGPTEADVITGR